MDLWSIYWRMLLYIRKHNLLFCVIYFLFSLLDMYINKMDMSCIFSSYSWVLCLFFLIINSLLCKVIMQTLQINNLFKVCIKIQTWHIIMLKCSLLLILFFLRIGKNVQLWTDFLFHTNPLICEGQNEPDMETFMFSSITFNIK